jgi:hypothetical protein
MVDAAFVDAFTKSFWCLTSRGNNVVTADFIGYEYRKGWGRIDVLEYEKLF